MAKHRKLIVGNWKMNGSRASVATLMDDLLPGVHTAAGAVSTVPGAWAAKHTVRAGSDRARVHLRRTSPAALVEDGLDGVTDATPASPVHLRVRRQRRQSARV